MQKTTLSRRAWWTAIGGMALAAGSATVVWRSVMAPIGRQPPAAQPAAYVDLDGWMVTSADKQKLAQTSLAPTDTP